MNEHLSYPTMSVLLPVFSDIRENPSILIGGADATVRSRLQINATAGAQGTGNRATDQEVCFASLLETHRIPILARETIPLPPPPYYIYQPNGSQQSIDFRIVEAGRITDIDLKHSLNETFYLNDGWFHENVVYIVTWGRRISPLRTRVVRELATFIGFGKSIPTEAESACMAEMLEMKNKYNKDHGRVGNLFPYVRFANRYMCNRFTPEFTEATYAIVAHSLSSSSSSTASSAAKPT